LPVCLALPSRSEGRDEKFLYKFQLAEEGGLEELPDPLRQSFSEARGIKGRRFSPPLPLK